MGSAVSQLFLIAAVLVSLPPQPTQAVYCDKDIVRLRAVQDVPEYALDEIQQEHGVVTLRFHQRDGDAAFAVALRAEGTRLTTSLKAVNLKPAQLSKLAAPIKDWWKDSRMQAVLAACSETPAADDPGDPDHGIRAAADAVLTIPEQPWPLSGETLVLLGGLTLSLGIALWPVFKQRGWDRSPATPRLDVLLVTGIALAGLAAASKLAWQSGPDSDEVVTLASRHLSLQVLMSFHDGGEPFNPPGGPSLFALWLRLAGGLFWARVLSLGLIPLTAIAAYRAGRGFANRAVGVCFAAMVIAAPSYLRLASIARVYSMIAFALCATLASIAHTRHARTRGLAVGAASLLGLWISYLLWPLALAAPWLARLTRTDRIRVLAALATTVATLAPRVVEGVHWAAIKTGDFPLKGSLATYDYALIEAAQGPPLSSFMQHLELVSSARLLGGALLASALILTWRRDRRLLRDVLIVVGLLGLPLFALLQGHLGIRDRHVLGLQVGVGLLLALGVGLLLSSSSWLSGRLLGCLLAILLLIGSFDSNRIELHSQNDWIPELPAMAAGVNTIVVIPEGAKDVAACMLFGDAPGPDTIRWDPVCPTARDTACCSMQGKALIGLTRITDQIVAAAAASGPSLWMIHSLGGDLAEFEDSGRLSAAMEHCERRFINSTWSVYSCPG